MLDCPVKNGAMGIGRRDRVRLQDGYLRLLTNLTAPKEIDASIVSDPKSNTDPVIREQ